MISDYVYLAGKVFYLRKLGKVLFLGNLILNKDNLFEILF